MRNFAPLRSPGFSESILLLIQQTNGFNHCVQRGANRISPPSTWLPCRPPMNAQHGPSRSPSLPSREFRRSRFSVGTCRSFLFLPGGGGRNLFVTCCRLKKDFGQFLRACLSGYLFWSRFSRGETHLATLKASHLQTHWSRARLLLTWKNLVRRPPKKAKGPSRDARPPKLPRPRAGREVRIS